MTALPISLLTLYADLVQQVETASPDEATVVASTVKGVRYLRLQRWVGETRAVEHLGRADDPLVRERADAARREMGARTARRTVVAALRRLVGGPAPKLGKVLDAIAHAGLFKRGAVLVGTAAYGCFPPLIGETLPSQALTTGDADLATADLALSSGIAGDTMERILRRADPGFTGVPGLDPRRPPARFRSPDGFLVDLLTPRLRRDDADPMPLERLSAGATPLQQLDWLIEGPIPAVALHGAGVPVVVPQPSRFAVHKLILAQKRPPGDVAKRKKDLMQAAALLAALERSAPFELADLLAEARARGRDGWERPIARSLAEIGRGP